MKSFFEVLTGGDGWEARDDGRAVLAFTPATGEGITVEIEPLLFGQYMLAVYDAEGDLVADKVPVYPGGTAAARTIAHGGGQGR